MFYFFLATSLLAAQSGSIDKALDLFLKQENSQEINSEDCIEAIFKACEIDNLSSSCSIQNIIKADIKRLFSHIKTLPKKSIEIAGLKKKHASLKRFQRYVTKHRVLYDFLGYARVLERRYKHAFNNEHIVEDVYHYTDLYEYSPKNGDALMKFLQLLKEDLGVISAFENKMHSRYGRLKSLNYAFKIECIKVRNEILFHPWYRYRLHRGSEFFADALSPVAYIIKVLFHVVPSVICIVGLTASTSLGGTGPNQD